MVTSGRHAPSSVVLCYVTQDFHDSQRYFRLQLLVIYLCGTHVKLEIHLSLPDNNVQNGASCMNHYLQPGVVSLMNIHEARDGKERFVQPVFWRSLR